MVSNVKSSNNKTHKYGREKEAKVIRPVRYSLTTLSTTETSNAFSTKSVIKR